MQRCLQSENLGTAGRLSGQVDRRLDGVAAGNQEQRLLERRHQELAELLMELEPRLIEKRVARVNKRLEAALDRLDDTRVVVP